jgi:hypothetical protein
LEAREIARCQMLLFKKGENGRDRFIRARDRRVTSGVVEM